VGTGVRKKTFGDKNSVIGDNLFESDRPLFLAPSCYSATYASRNGVPLEVVSKVILRHQDLTTTQVYLGKIDDAEAIRWMDILQGK